MSERKTEVNYNQKSILASFHEELMEEFPKIDTTPLMDPVEKMYIRDYKKNKHAGETPEEKEARRKKKNRKKQLGMDVSSDTDSFHEEVEKTGYEFTPYMTLYNANTKMDYTKGYDPKKMDDVYKQGLTYELSHTQMPKAVSFTFDWKLSGIEITK